MLAGSLDHTGYAWHMRGAVHPRVPVQARSTVLSLESYSGPACTIIPFHMLACLLSIQGPMVYCVYAHMIRMISPFSITPLQVDAIKPS